MSTDLIKIGIISDTHMRLSETASDTLAGRFDESQIYEHIKLDRIEASKYKLGELISLPPKLILHAGDIGQQLVIDVLDSIAPVKAVNGNCDFSDFKTQDGFTENFIYFEYEGLRIAMAHTPQDLEFGIHGSFMRAPQIGKDSPLPDVAVHGHTHCAEILLPNSEDNPDPYVEICPGSATQGRYGTPNSVAFLYIKDGKPLIAQLVRV